MANDDNPDPIHPIERIYQMLLTKRDDDSADQGGQADKRKEKKKSGKTKHQIEKLFKDVQNERNKDPKLSKTAKLFADGRTKIAKKVVEEAAEVSLDYMSDDRDGVTREVADLLYNIVVLMAEMDIHPREIWREMDARAKEFGIAEKLPKARRKGKPAPIRSLSA